MEVIVFPEITDPGDPKTTIPPSVASLIFEKNKPEVSEKLKRRARKEMSTHRVSLDDGVLAGQTDSVSDTVLGTRGSNHVVLDDG